MRAITNFVEAQAALGQFVPVKPEQASYTLAAIKKFMALLGNPQDNLKIIHVAGTSGKTSTAYYVASLLHAAGHTTGLTVSPHIDQISERAQINMQGLPETEYCQELSKFLDIVDASTAELSYFEVLVAFAYWLFDKRGVDYAVIEVGLGGLLDGTNVVNRADKVCIITDIGFDHTNVLGNSLHEIAFQKAGIIHPGNVVFMNDQTQEVTDVIDKVCQDAAAQLHILRPKDISKIQLSSKLPLFQKRNLLLALAAVNYINERDHTTYLTAEQIRQASHVYIPGRMEVMHYHGKTLVLDGSHNEQKIGALVDSMAPQFIGSQVALLVSFGTNKDPSVIASLELLRSLGSTIIVTQFDGRQDEVRKPIEPNQLADYARQAGFETIIIEPDRVKAIGRLVSDPAEIGLITGSFYLLNHIREIILADD